MSINWNNLFRFSKQRRNRLIASLNFIILAISFEASAGSLITEDIISGNFVTVNNYYGQYSKIDKIPGVPSPGLEGPIAEQLIAPNVSPKNARLAVFLPHLKDPYWVTVQHGVWAEALKLGITTEFYEAGGYLKLGTQVRQLEYVIDKGDIDGVLIGPVQYGTPYLNEIYDALEERGIPIVALCIDTRHSAIDAKAMVPWFEMGFAAGKYVAEHSAGRRVKVAVLPGPKGLGWVEASYNGILAALEEFGAKERVEIIGPSYGDTGDRVQRFRIGLIVKEHANIDYLIGNALAAMAAIRPGPDGAPPALQGWKEKHPNLKIVSTYVTPEVYDAIGTGEVLAASTDLMKYQGIIAVDMMARILNGEQPGDKNSAFPFRSGPVVRLITTQNVAHWDYDRLFAPKGYLPYIQTFE